MAEVHPGQNGDGLPNRVPQEHVIKLTVFVRREAVYLADHDAGQVIEHPEQAKVGKRLVDAVELRLAQPDIIKQEDRSLERGPVRRAGQRP